MAGKGVIAQLSDMVFQAGLVAYFFVYYLVKGHHSESPKLEAAKSTEDGGDSECRSSEPQPELSTVNREEPPRSESPVEWVQKAHERSSRYQQLSSPPVATKAPLGGITSRARQDFLSEPYSPAVDSASHGINPFNPPGSTIPPAPPSPSNTMHIQVKPPNSTKRTITILSTSSSSGGSHSPKPRSETSHVTSSGAAVPGDYPAAFTAGSSRTTSDTFTSQKTIEVSSQNTRRLNHHNQKPQTFPKPKRQISPSLDITQDERAEELLKLRRQWPPPSNASGVEIIKDLFVKADDGYAPNLPSAPIQEIAEEWRSPPQATFSPVAQSVVSTEPETTVNFDESMMPKAFRDPQPDVKIVSSAKSIEKSTHSTLKEQQFQLTKLLNSDSGTTKGAQLFARRREHADQWVVDESKIPPSAIKRREVSVTKESNLGKWKPVDPDQDEQLEKWKESRKLQLVQSPWDAALNDPQGVPNSAFERVNPQKVADTVVTAAKAKFFSTEGGDETPIGDGMFEHIYEQNRPFSPPRPPRSTDRRSRLFSPERPQRSRERESRLVNASPAPFVRAEMTRDVSLPARSLATPTTLAVESQRWQSRSPYSRNTPVGDDFEKRTLNYADRTSQFGAREMSQPQTWTPAFSDISPATPMTPSFELSPQDSMMARSFHSQSVTPIPAFASTNTLPKSWKNFSSAYKSNYGGN